MGVDAVQQVAEVSAGELPGEWPGDGVVADLERGEAVADLVQVGEVAGVEDFALDDGEVDRARAASTASSSPGRTIWYELSTGICSLCRTAVLYAGSRCTRDTT